MGVPSEFDSFAQRPVECLQQPFFRLRIRGPGFKLPAPIPLESFESELREVAQSRRLPLSSMLRDNDGADARGAFWAEAIAPFLRDYWPNDVSARTTEVSENLAHLPALAGTTFEQAVGAVLDLVCPIQRYEIRLGGAG